MKILRDKDIEPGKLSRYIKKMLLESRPLETVPINLDGAANTARWLEDWHKKHKQTTKSRKDESTK